MKEYNSINIVILDDEIQHPSNCKKKSSTPSTYQVDSNNYISEESSSNNYQKPTISVYVLLITLLVGAAAGFSIASFASGGINMRGPTEYQNDFSSLKATETNANILTEDFDWDRGVKMIEELLNFDIPYLLSTKSKHDSIIDDGLTAFTIPGTTVITTGRPLLYLNRPDSYQLLLDSVSPLMTTISQYSPDFFLLSSGLDAQINQAYCGVASAVAVLNSLRFLKSSSDGSDGIDIPVDERFAPYPYVTQTDIFGQCSQEKVILQTGGGPGVDGILTPPFGLGMGQIAELLRCHLNATNWNIDMRYMDSTHYTIGKLRFDLKNALADENSRVIVNYDRNTVGQIGGGHWSPVGSYSEKQDAFLIVDVAKYKYPPVWIPTEKLFSAMATFDDCGYWDYPWAQQYLTKEERLPGDGKLYATAAEKLGCSKRLRGYIVITKAA